MFSYNLWMLWGFVDNNNNYLEKEMRHEGLLKLIIEGSVEGKNHRRWPRLEYIQQIIKDQECNSYVEIKRKADIREEWNMAAIQIMVWNYRARESEWEKERQIH